MGENEKELEPIEEEYRVADYDELIEVSDRLMEENREAYEKLAES